MKLGFVLWTVFCLIVAAGLAWKFQADNIYSGKNDLFRAGDTNELSIDGPVSLEAASSSFFAIRQINGEKTIVGVLTKAPLGWSGTEYFKSEPILVQGDWTVEKGSNITFHVTSSESVTVIQKLKPNVKAFTFLLTVIASVAVWGFVVLIAEQ